MFLDEGLDISFNLCVYSVYVEPIISKHNTKRSSNSALNCE